MEAIFWLIDFVLQFVVIMIVIRVIFSWLVSFGAIEAHHPIVAQLLEFFYRLTEPLLEKARRVIPLIAGIDLSPLVLIVVIEFARRLIANDLYPLLFG